MIIYYFELKVYGYNCEGVVNVSVEFDIEILSFIYKLLIGVLGWSNVFEILKCLGLSVEVIECVKGYIGLEINKVENMIVFFEDSCC